MTSSLFQITTINYTYQSTTYHYADDLISLGVILRSIIYSNLTNPVEIEISETWGLSYSLSGIADLWMIDEINGIISDIQISHLEPVN